MDELIELKLAGQGISPERLRLKDLADLLGRFEDAVTSTVIRDHPEISRDEIVIGLVHVRKGSVGLALKPQLPEIVYPAYEEIAYAFKNNDFRQLPAPAVDALRHVVSFTRRLQYDLQFNRVNGRTQTLVTITPQTVITPKEFFSGSTTIYGWVVRVGGAEPKVWLKLTTSQDITCETTAEIAKLLANRLYTWVGLDGEAKWATDTGYLAEFKIRRLTEYEETIIPDAFLQLSELYGSYYEDIEDVDSFVAELRCDLEE